MSDKKELVLVSCSSGLDSTCTLQILQLAGYENLVACHFRYGTRSDEAEFLAITNICNHLKIPLRVFDVRNLYTEMGVESISMLANENAEIVTGTTKGLKTTAAWHPMRNGLFQTIMMTFAEAEVMKYDYKKVYFCAGWNQLTESACYPDNTKYFSDACIGMAKYASLVGNRFSMLYCLANLMKTEQYVLANSFGFLDLFDMCISCDRAKIVDGVPCNCSKNDMPACGSGLLSAWSEKMLGLETNRNFYEVDDPDYVAHIPKHIKDQFSKNPDINDIIGRILLPDDKIENLRRLLK
jgi:7-cyano-7-deazaguanine synthase in queuosine biosynthesis